jgi:hypothetical protein
MAQRCRNMSEWLKNILSCVSYVHLIHLVKENKYKIMNLLVLYKCHLQYCLYLLGADSNYFTLPSCLIVSLAGFLDYVHHLLFWTEMIVWKLDLFHHQVKRWGDKELGMLQTVNFPAPENGTRSSTSNIVFCVECWRFDTVQKPSNSCVL